MDAMSWTNDVDDEDLNGVKMMIEMMIEMMALMMNGKTIVTNDKQVLYVQFFHNGGRLQI